MSNSPNKTDKVKAKGKIQGAGKGQETGRHEGENKYWKATALKAKKTIWQETIGNRLVWIWRKCLLDETICSELS